MTSAALNSNLFVSKLDSNGNYVWVKQGGVVNTLQPNGISVDSSGNVYTAGSFDVSKLDSNGNSVWTQRLRRTNYAQINDMSVDSSGNVYTTGFFKGTVDFERSAGTVKLTSAGSQDAFISKLDTNGNYVWAKQLGGTQFTEANSISVDNSGNVYTVGNFTGTVDFDPGTGVVSLTSSGSATNAFVSKLSQNSVPNSRPLQPTANDFDGDGKADLLTTHSNYLGKVTQPSSLTYSVTLSTSTSLSIAALPSNFQLIATIDYNGDGKADLLWKNNDNNTYSTWFLDGNTYIGGGVIGVVASNFEIVSTADFDGDGKADLLWKNKDNNTYSNWLLNGNVYIGGGIVAKLLNNFELVGTGDYNGDGKTDLLWKNTANNSYSTWLLNGNRYIGGGTIATLSFNFQIIATNDYNGDGKADLLWKDSNTSTYSNWFLDGNRYIGGGTIATLPLNFEIVSSRDYNGDDAADLVWVDRSNGVLSEWFLNGSTYIGGEVVGTVTVGEEVSDRSITPSAPEKVESRKRT